jgi:hypothetical protein
VSDDAVTYRSGELRVELRFDRVDHTNHEVDGVPVDWSEFDHGFQTPWSANPYGSHEATLDKGGHSVEYDWDPDGDGTFDEMPTKIVDGRSVFG